MNDAIKYILLGRRGYCFDPVKGEVRTRFNGVETVIEPKTEEMGRANDALTGNTLGYGVGGKGEEITAEEYENL